MVHTSRTEIENRGRQKRLAAALALLALWGLLVVVPVMALEIPAGTAAAQEEQDSALFQIRAFLARAEYYCADFESLARPYPAHPWSQWGLGTIEDEYVSNNASYNWYINQTDTGQYGFENCGPASVTMACMWADPFFRHTAEEARAAYHSSGGWWYMEDIANYMNLYDIPNREVSNRGNQVLMNYLRQGNIVIINIDLRELTYNPNPVQHVDKFYTGGTGHFIIIKGFAVIDGNIFFECYDPATQNYFYPFERYSTKRDPMGRDRYYRGEEIQQAMYNWYNLYLLIEPKY